jgi:hypothetical protein
MYYVKGLGYRNTRMGGFGSINAAVRAIGKRGGVGYVMTQSREVTHAVRNGRIVSLG